MVGQPFIIRLTGQDWDLSLCNRLKALLAPALDHPKVVIDMDAVGYIDSSCLNQLVHLHNERVAKRGFFPARFVINSPNVRRLFTIANLERLWPIFETVDEACADAGTCDELPSNDSSPHERSV